MRTIDRVAGRLLAALGKPRGHRKAGSKRRAARGSGARRSTRGRLMRAGR